MRSCAIMVLNWNGADWLRRSLPSIVDAASRTGAEVWVVDNASADESEQVCRESFPTVRFFPVGGNLVLAAYNVAAAACDREVLVFLNNDLVVDADFLAPLLRHFGDPEVFAVASCVRSFPPSEDAAIEMEAYAPTWSQGLIRAVERSSTVAVPTWFTIGGAMACRRGMFLEIGGFDELYFPTYHDDVDLSWRAWKRGWSCWYEPSSVVYHAGGATMGRSDRVRTMMSRNELLFHWKNLSAPSLLVAHALALFPRVGTRAIRGDWAALRGFWEAVRRVGAVRRSREKALSLVRCSDTEVLRRFHTLEARALAGE